MNFLDKYLSRPIALTISNVNVKCHKEQELIIACVTGEEDTTGEESRAFGGQRAREQLRPYRGRGDASSGAALHSVPPGPQAEDV